MSTLRTILLNMLFPFVFLIAQEGKLDVSFNTTGKVITEIGTSNDGADVVMLDGGKFLVGGTSTISGKEYFTVVRYLSSGSVDPTFGTDGIVTIAAGASHDRLVKMLLQPDGKILLGGMTTPAGETYSGFTVARLNGNGDRDSAFGVNGVRTIIIGQEDNLKGLALQPDGKIVMSGSTKYDEYSHTMLLIRITSTGAIDPSFCGSGIWQSWWSSDMTGFGVAVQPDGKIIASGIDMFSYSCQIYRLNSDGSWDESFGDEMWWGTYFDYSDYIYNPNSIIVLADGKILIGGNNDNSFRVKRLNTNGTLDLSFGINGLAKLDVIGVIATCADMALQSDGRIVIAGSIYDWSTLDVAVARFTQDGIVDTGFGNNGLSLFAYGTHNDVANSVAVQTDEQLILAGTYQTAERNRFGIARIIGNDGPTLTYSRTGFYESTQNDGTIDNTDPLVITLGRGSFTGTNGDDLVSAGTVLCSHLPSGLTAIVTRTSSTSLALTLTGTETNHTPLDNRYDIEFAFQNGAFMSGDASSVKNHSKYDIEINHLEAANQAIRLDGVDDHLVASSDIWFNGNCTIEAWVYLHSYTYWARLIDFGNGSGSHNVIVALNTGNSGIPSFHIFRYADSQFIQASSPLPLEQWTHIACVLNGTMAYMYINGVLSGSGTMLPPFGVNRTRNYIGRSNWSSDAYADVTIDELRIWNVARTQQQIRTTMHRVVSPASSGLVGYWQFNEERGTTADERHGRTAALINTDMTPTSGWTSSGMPAGPGTCSAAENIWETADLGDVNLTMTDGFDSDVNISCTTIGVSPNMIPLDYSSVIGDRYTIINTFGYTGTFSTDMTIRFGPDALDSRVDASPGAVKLFRRNSCDESGWTEIGGASSACSATGEVTWCGITSFSQFAAVFDETALPVELSTFTAIARNRGAELTWTTASEVNNSGFEIQKRLVPIDVPVKSQSWEKIGFVHGHGTSNVPNSYSFLDPEVTGTILYRLKQVDNNGSIKYSPTVEVKTIPPTVCALFQNHPNPFNPVTDIQYQVSSPGVVSLKVYDMLGRETAVLVNEEQQTGRYSVKWDASNRASGIYFYTLQTGQFRSTKKMNVVK